MQVKEVIKLNYKSCADCYYNDDCGTDDYVCDSYMPITFVAEQDFIDEMIENNRYSFREEWFEYIEENNN